QDVTVGEEKDALLPAGLPEAPDDLERRVGLSGARRHDEQHAILPLRYSLDRGVDRVDLIVARRLAAAVVVVILKDDPLRVAVETLPGTKPRPQVSRRRKGIERQRRFAWRAGAGSIVEHESVAVRGKHERDVQRLRIVERLLDAAADTVGVVLRLDQGDGDV